MKLLLSEEFSAAADISLFSFLKIARKRLLHTPSASVWALGQVHIQAVSQQGQLGAGTLTRSWRKVTDDDDIS